MREGELGREGVNKKVGMGCRGWARLKLVDGDAVWDLVGGGC